jgi:hypothetical protein
MPLLSARRAAVVTLVNPSLRHPREPQLDTVLFVGNGNRLSNKKSIIRPAHEIHEAVLFPVKDWTEGWHLTPGSWAHHFCFSLAPVGSAAFAFQLTGSLTPEFFRKTTNIFVVFNIA